MQRKTRRPVQFEPTEQTREAVQAWITQAKLTADHFPFPSRLYVSLHVSTRQYAKMVDAWVASTGLDPSPLPAKLFYKIRPRHRHQIVLADFLRMVDTEL